MLTNMFIQNHFALGYLLYVELEEPPMGWVIPTGFWVFDASDIGHKYCPNAWVSPETINCVPFIREQAESI